MDRCFMSELNWYSGTMMYREINLRIGQSGVQSGMDGGFDKQTAQIKIVLTFE
jgi:hypothetical protein